MVKKLVRIGKAAKLLNVSMMTLRRWDESGYLKAIRIHEGGDRFYEQRELELLMSDIFKMANDWVVSSMPSEPSDEYFCPDISVFQARQSKLESSIQCYPELGLEFSLITSVVGELGNNSFDHNVGAWPDVRGIFFAYDLKKRQVVLADRGQGVLTTLKRVRPDLDSDEEALGVAFTEKISGRAPESRGNGLKFVRRAVIQPAKNISMKLTYQSGMAELTIKKGDSALDVSKSPKPFRGCLAMLNY